MFNKIKKLSIKNPAIGRGEEGSTLEEMAQDVLYEIACCMMSEINQPKKDMLWPRKWHIHMSNGNNELVVAKLDVQKFADVDNSGDEINKFVGKDADEIETESDEDEGGEIREFSTASTPCLYLDFGYRDDDEEGIIQSRALIVSENLDELKTKANQYD